MLTITLRCHLCCLIYIFLYYEWKQRKYCGKGVYAKNINTIIGQKQSEQPSSPQGPYIRLQVRLVSQSNIWQGDLHPSIGELYSQVLSLRAHVHAFHISYYSITIIFVSVEYREKGWINVCAERTRITPNARI